MLDKSFGKCQFTGIDMIFGKPEEIAAACLFLAIDEASLITGQVLQVEGGGYLP